METTKSGQESGKTSGYGTATTTKKSEASKGSQSDESTSGLSAQIERGEKIVSDVKETVTEAYDRTAKSLNEGYVRAVDYGRANPGKTSLIIFGAGLGVGLLLAANSSGRSRKGRIVTPVMNALTDIATQLFR